MSYRIIDRHNGKIGIISKENEGSTFFFGLPAKRNLSTGVHAFNSIDRISDNNSRDNISEDINVISSGVSKELNIEVNNSSVNASSEMHLFPTNDCLTNALSPSRLSLSPIKNVLPMHSVFHFPRVLVVDDSDLNRKMMIKLLSRYFDDVCQVSRIFDF